MPLDIVNHLADAIGMADVHGRWLHHGLHPTGWKAAKKELDGAVDGYFRPDESYFQLMFCVTHVERKTGKTIDVSFNGGKIEFTVDIGRGKELRICDKWESGVSNELQADICAALYDWWKSNGR